MKYSENKIHATTIAWDTVEGKRRLFESRFNKDFFELAHRFQPQMKPTYCGVASAVTVLNALRLKTGLRIDSGLEVQAPATHGGNTMHYNSYSQLTFMNEQTDAVKPRDWVEGVTVACETTGDIVFEPGLSLDQLARKLKHYLLSVQAKHADITEQPKTSKDNPVTRFRQDLMAYLNDKSTFIIVNYLGRDIGKNVGGHFSPIAAYHKATDSCLVMDVAGHKHPWFWVSLQDLYHAMATQDGTDTRGYLLVSDKLRH
ncbi:MAG: phytochelatin synthase family protein [Rickettsiales bacterium]|nr:phytochelatin synthase family protein [Rickettsiales bacterium]